MNALPVDQRANFGTITPVAALFKGIGDTAFGFMLPVLAGFIAMAIGNRPALAVGFVSGMIASQGKSGFLGALVAGFAAGYLIIAPKHRISQMIKVWLNFRFPAVLRTAQENFERSAQDAGI